MTYILNISFVIPEKVEHSFTEWTKKDKELFLFSLFRILGSNNDGSVTLCLQQKHSTIQELQKNSSHMHSFLTSNLATNFKEEINFFMSALEEI